MQADSLDMLLDKAVKQLRTGIRILSAIEDMSYTQVYARSYGTDSTVGKQWRHVVNFYEQFLSGYAVGEIDYTSRERNEQMEQRRQYGLQKAELVLGAFGALQMEDKDLLVRDDIGVARSTTAAELQRLASHTTHHYALLREMLVIEGIAVPTSFGYAPTTWQHKATTDRG